ncbi:MAG: hypothetical protein CVU29_12000 [Betaproteobacteria bacterium HGW-Betaproteobacteria-22]|nr:MAG: hypothetical protein CVU29_12000 [Betaproteobacteria bacterium HGW-Betaproteobacteria-22]
MSQKKYEGVDNDMPVIPKENTMNTTDSDHGRLLEVLFPAFFNDGPIDPESQKYLIKELEQQRFQKSLQNNNNRDMKNLLRNTAPKVGR